MQEPEINFEVENQDYDLYLRVDTWESWRQWFVDKGYTPYKLDYSFEANCYGVATTSPNYPFLGEIVHPYSNFGGDPPDLKRPALYTTLNGRVIFAQDTQDRHVAIKLVRRESEQYRILRFLAGKASLFSPELFECILPPVDFLEAGKYCFVVMPRWGTDIDMPWFSTIREALFFMHTMLKATNFLHKNGIVHRDIKLDNMLVNHFCAGLYDHNNPLRGTLRQESRVQYALFDFDISIMFEPDSTPAERRLPSEFSREGGYHQPYDTSQGELDYDPFAFDVACMRIFFREYLQQLTNVVPMLAPLIDGMTTHVLRKRFTAAEALEFFAGMYETLTEEQLNAPALPMYESTADKIDVWDGVSEHFAKAWASYRSPDFSLATLALRWICRTKKGYVAVQGIRKSVAFFRGLFRPTTSEFNFTRAQCDLARRDGQMIP